MRQTNDCSPVRVMQHKVMSFLYLSQKILGRPSPWASGWVDLELCPRVWSNPAPNLGVYSISPFPSVLAVQHLWTSWWRWHTMIHERNALRDVLAQWVGKLLLKSIIALWINSLGYPCHLYMAKWEITAREFLIVPYISTLSEETAHSTVYHHLSQ